MTDSINLPRVLTALLIALASLNASFAKEAERNAIEGTGSTVVRTSFSGDKTHAAKVKEISTEKDQAENSEKESASQPNVLFIAIDDLNDWVGCLKGHPNAKTPHIDALAQRGVLFSNAQCQAPICGPSRASLFTGLYPTTTGIYLHIDDQNIRNANAATKTCTFLPDFFEEHGYRTLGVGKIFHGGDQAKTFDEYGGRFSWFGPKPKKRFKYDPTWFGKPKGTQTDWGVYPEREEETTDYQSAQWAIGQIKKSQDKPFFLAVGFIRPHVPWYVPKKWFDLHPLDTIQLPPYRADDLDDVPAMGRRVAEVPMMPTAVGLKSRRQWKEAIQAYLACCSFTDHWVGQVVKALDESPYAKNTIIVLWSDHGYHLGEKNRFAKQAIWERATKAPLIVAGPNIEGNRRCDRAVGLIDIYPTVVDLCGLKANAQNEGRSLKPLLENVEEAWPHPSVSAYGPVNFAIRSQKYRYIRYEDGSEELYDMEADPNEWTNLAEIPQFETILKDHRKHLPSKAAPLAKKSNYKPNAYFRDRSNRWRETKQ